MSRARRRVGTLALVSGLGAALTLGSVGSVGASSHREAPLISQDPVADTTDVYAFVSPDRPDTVTMIANWIPLEEPAGGPNFYRFGDDVRYEINIDNNGDAVDDIVYQFRFTTQIRNPNTFLYATGPITSLNDPDYNIRQVYSVARVQHGRTTTLGSNLATPPVNIGPVSTPHYERLAAAAVHSLSGGIKVFAGQRDDPFFVDLGSAFDLGQLRPFLPAYQLNPREAKRGKDGVGGYNVHTIAIQVPVRQLTHDGMAPTSARDSRAVIGVYSETQRRQTRVLSAVGAPPMSSGQWVNVSRLGHPLVNEVVIPLGKKDRFNSSEPSDDAQFASHVLNPELAAAIEALYGVRVPDPPRNDLVAIFLTGIRGLNMPANVQPSEMLRLNMTIAPSRHENPLGVLGGDLAGYPNGRRLGDDSTDIELRALAGGTPLTPRFNRSPNNDLGDGVNKNDRRFLRHFPYVATPWPGYLNTHGTPGGFPSPLPDPR